MTPLMKRRRHSLDSELEMQLRGVCISSVAFTSCRESFYHSAPLANISKRRDIIISVPLWLLELLHQIYQAVALGQKWEMWGKWWLVLGASSVTAGVQVGPTRQADSAYPCQSFFSISQTTLVINIKPKMWEAKLEPLKLMRWKLPRWGERGGERSII